MKRAEQLHQVGPLTLRHLGPGSDSADILFSTRVRRGRDRANFRTIQQIQGHNSPASTRGYPGEQEHVGVQKSFTTLPPVGGPGVYIQIPQDANAKRLETRKVKVMQPLLRCATHLATVAGIGAQFGHVERWRYNATRHTFRSGWTKTVGMFSIVLNALTLASTPSQAE